MFWLYLPLLYIEHMIIYWGYSFVWNIFNKNIYNKKDAYLVAKYSLNIQLFVLLPLGILFYTFYNNRKNIIEIPTGSLYECFQIILLFLWEDFIFYVFHRILHTKRMYKYHKLHHRWTQPVPWGTLYASITENICLNFFPVLSGPVIVGLNIYYMFAWVGLATLSSLIAHSRIGGSHDIHHQKFNVNYGNTKFIDKIFGTYQN